MEQEAPELASVEAFVEHLLDDERTCFSYVEAVTLGKALGVTETAVIRALKDYGLTYGGRPVERRVRGFLSNPHDRYFGPGACRTHGGSGWEQITGMAGQEG